MTSGAERRATKRHAAHFDVRFAEAADAVRAFNAFSVNFSSTGLCIRSRKIHVVGDTLWLSLSIEGESFELEGEVSWVRGEAVGVRFVNVTAPVRMQLEDVARDLSERVTPTI